MKIVTWNCNMAFRKKAIFILAEKPDVLIIPECENPEKLIFNKDTMKPTDIYWYGDNPNKGLGIFSYCDYKITPLANHDASFRYVLPLTIENEHEKIICLAVWAQKPDKHDNYGIQIWNAINFYADLLRNENVIIIGDFNSSAIWDKPNREANHTNIVKLLNELNFESAYHYFHKQEQGSETDPTLYLHRKLDRPYHIDYCFTSKSLTKRLKNVRIGKYDDWKNYSDHIPLTVIF